MTMLEIEPSKILVQDLHKHLLSSVGPRPIALASTIDKEGNKNVSPFSFFNVFSANPPIAVFSPARRIRNNTTKDTLENIKEIQEVVINVVSSDLVEKASLASTEYPKEIDEFIKSDLTPIPSKKIKPFRVKESPVQMECKVNQIIELGKNGGAGNLIICEIILIHISQDILDENNQIDPNKIQLVGRLGGNWYSKGFEDAIFQIKKPKT
jgi:flavin reductase (DIM6/NTAB) family NADH-FMN oxidoreductase RutF